MSKKESQSGQSILEVIVAMAIFSLIAATMITMVTGSFIGLVQGGQQTEANALAQEGMEAMRNIRDKDWDDLTCTNCVVSASNGEWALSEGSNQVIDKYSRIITLSDVYRDSNDDIVDSGTPGAILDRYTKLAQVEVIWTVREGVTNLVKRVAYLTNWKYPSGGECLVVDTTNACFDDSNSMKSLINMTLANPCSDDFTLIKTTPSWNNQKNIENITIDGLERWDWSCDWNCSPVGRQTYGLELDFGDNDLTIGAGATVDVDKYEWNGNMSGSEVSFIFAFDDDTLAEVFNFSPPDCGSNDVGNYCQGLGYSTGTCRANSNQCTSNGEIYESGGDQYCTDGRRADTACCLPASDTTAPSAISDLVLSGATSNSIDLIWTAPGDDGSTGTATSYDVRYSTSVINTSNWVSATQVVDEPIPSMAGSSESMTVNDLDSNTVYYFAIKTSDEVPNGSNLSNIPSLSTASAPVIIFEETFSNSDRRWNGSSDTSQDEPGWSVIQGNRDNNDIQISNEDSGLSPSGGNHLTFEDCDHGFYTPEAYDIAYVSINLSGYTNVGIEYYWQSDDVDGNEGMRVAYSTDSTDGKDGTWTQIAEYLNPSDNSWIQATFDLPDVAAVSSFILRFSSKSNATSEHMYVDDITIIGYE